MAVKGRLKKITQTDPQSKETIKPKMGIHSKYLQRCCCCFFNTTLGKWTSLCRKIINASSKPVCNLVQPQKGPIFKPPQWITTTLKKQGTCLFPSALLIQVLSGKECHCWNERQIFGLRAHSGTCFSGCAKSYFLQDVLRAIPCLSLPFPYIHSGLVCDTP